MTTTLVAALPGVAGCPGRLSGELASDGGPAGLVEPTCAAGIDVETDVFAARCATAGCHDAASAAGGLDLISPDVAARLVGVPATGCSGLLIDPDQPEASVLSDKIAPSPSCGSPMPPVGDPLEGEERDCVRAWIADAVDANDGTEPDPADPGRVATGLVTLLEFTGPGPSARDAVVAGGALDLDVVQGSSLSFTGTAVDITAGSFLVSADPATKVIDRCRANNAVTVEAWIAPANLIQAGPARIVTVSGDPLHRNLTIGQSGAGIEAQLRTSTTDEDASTPRLVAGSILGAGLAHVVFTRDPGGAGRLYVDGVEVATAQLPGDLSTWNPGYRLGVANEMVTIHPWLGRIHLVAIYDRALSQAEVTQNFGAGADPQ